MKVSPRTDYPVRVVAQEWDEDPAAAQLYRGVYAMVLNHVVEVVFVPDVSGVAPPWDGRQLPPSLDQVSTVEQARLSAALLASYAVTPNDTYAGEIARFRWPPDAEAGGVVRYVTAADFDRYAEDLVRLSGIVGNRFPDKTVSDLRGYEVVRFVETAVVAAPWLRPADAAMLGRGTP